MKQSRFLQAISLADRTPPTGLRPVRVHAEHYVEAVDVEPHCHVDLGQLLAPTHGVIRVTTEDNQWLVPPGRALLVPPGVVHAVHSPKEGRLRAVLIAPEMCRDYLSTCRVIALTILLQELIDAVARYPADYSIPSPASRMVVVVLDQIALAHSEPLGVSRPSDARLRRVTDALMAFPADSRSLSEWQDVAGASSRTLARLFEVETGMSFSHYRRQVQMQAAVGMLASGMPVGEIAHALAYSTASAFAFAFRKTFGCPPSRFRDQVERSNCRAV
ncbi:AraC family transcriptional regulator [Acetobacter senegalensis]|uniref:AraC family transcriptional regulator n=1 Tax=Acetobacter senegalensis TaxID=446692 RepID=UPI001EDA9903|nr:helix-turn-helix transcriptional regulator [Acetobacter senegalensis]MCG4256554.1 helix-turn-helix transcriptional regulator [Acetobacter senegalensis]MCG4266460.1 helix-turn-helix transcriptional regulator [Acetobacter senegalensis]